MLKLLRLCAFTALLLCYSGSSMADSETFRVKFMGTPVPSTIPFGTENVKLLFGNLYTTNCIWENNPRTINGETIYAINCNDDAKLADGSNPKGKVPAKGCYYQFTPLKDGILNVTLVIKTEQERDLYIINESGNSIYTATCMSDNNTLLPYNTNKAFTIPNTNKEYRKLNCRFNVSAGTTYYVYGGSTKPGFAGYDFYQYGETETFMFPANTAASTTAGTIVSSKTNIILTAGDSYSPSTKAVNGETITWCIPSSNGDKSTVPPVSGGFWKFKANAKGLLTVKLITKGKTTETKETYFKAVNAAGESVAAVCTTNGERLEYTADGYKVKKNDKDDLTLCEFYTEPDGEYYVYSTGTKLGFAGYDFIPEGNKESLTVGADQKPGKVYQTLSRTEEQYTQDKNSLPAILSSSPALYITLGNGIWSSSLGTLPIDIAATKTHKPGENDKDFDKDGKYILNSHFKSEIIPNNKSIPTDKEGKTAYIFDAKDNKSLPVQGAFYTVTAMKTGTVYLYFDKSDKKKFGTLWITDSKGNPVDTYPNGIYSNDAGKNQEFASDAEGGIALYNKTQSFMFHATAGTTYYVFNSQKSWTDSSTSKTEVYNDPSRIGLAGVIYSDGLTDVTNTYYYNLMSGNVHEVGDQIKTAGMVMTFGGQDKKNNIYTMTKQDDVFISYGENTNVELTSGYATAGSENPTNELKGTQFNPNAKNTHSLPYYGTFYKFEPQCSGQLTVHVLQNGALDLDENGKPSTEVLEDQELKVRPLYIADEKGNLVPINNTEEDIQVHGKLKYANTGDGYDFTSFKKYDIYKTQWEAATKDGDFNISKSSDGGYVLINKAYCKYTFDVKPGKTYFIFTNASKLGFCGYKFIPAGTTPAAQTLEEASTAEPMFTENTDIAITLKREFKADTWMPVTLPYSMTETQVKNTFGEGTMVIYFDGIEGNTIKFKKHAYQMIVAGRPCFVKPTKSGDAFGPADEAATEKTVNNITFKPSLAHVTIDGATIEPDVNGEATGTLNGKFNFTLNASYAKQEKALKPNDYYFGGDGKIYRTQEGENWDIKGYRSFLKCSDNTSGAKAILAGADFGEDSGTTAIDNVEADNGCVISAKAVVYDLNGRIVKTSTEGLKDLVKGVYIVDGKKVIIK